MSLDISVARLEERLKNLSDKLDAVDDRIDELNRELIKVRDVTTKGRNVLTILAVIGAIAGWVIAQANGLLGLFGKH